VSRYWLEPNPASTHRQIGSQIEDGRLLAGMAILNKPYRKADLARRLREVLNAPRYLH
jgi:hypothetical protein